MENQEMIQAFSPHASQKAFTNGIRSRRPVRRSKDFDATRCCHSCEIRPEFAVIISNQIARPFSIRSRFAQLLCDPGIGRGSRHLHMDHLPRLQLDDEEGKKRTVEEICHLQEITGPHLCSMIAKKRLPGLSTGSLWANLPHILLDGPLLTRISSLSSSSRMRSAPQSRLFAAISLIKVIVSSESLGFLECTFDLCIQNTRKSSRGPRRSVVFLDKEERLFPGPNHPGENHQEQPVCLPVDRSFDLSTQDDQLVS